MFYADQRRLFTLRQTVQQLSRMWIGSMPGLKLQVRWTRDDDNDSFERLVCAAACDVIIVFVSREHFHCLDCNSRVFVKKEEMIRHFKWHKKRDESLQHGFMRYSPSDDCSDRYQGCSHNRKQTHYHCIQVYYMHKFNSDMHKIEYINTTSSR